MELPDRFRPEGDPTPAEGATVRGPDYRFTVLTPQLLRLEFDPRGTFEDRPSQTFWNRDLPVPEFAVEEREGRVVVDTERLRLEYDPDRGFDAGSGVDGGPEDDGDDNDPGGNPSVELRGTEGAIRTPTGAGPGAGSSSTWRYGDAGETLGGATRTLDGVDGHAPLEAGLVSRQGWAVVDDTDSLVFDDGWVRPREAHDDYRDLYVFGYGEGYRAAVEDYVAVAGRPPMVPRWALGNWWSRYWEYTAGELQDLMAAFEERDLPLSVCVVDMDWHLVDDAPHDGWTGWTWNEEYFPDPEGFVGWLHDNDLRTALNLHPAEGVHPHEDAYEAFAESMGIDPESGDPVAFDAADPSFLAGYFEHLIHPMEDEAGIDFWWIDWQQGAKSPELEGLDPLWALNHTHALDRTRDGRRPFVLSRWPGLGGHRYPVGFSGDHRVSWASLRFQPYLTASSANVAFGWWSHDVGGHYGGTGDPRRFGELYARWLQFGVFSPINRIHTTKDPFVDKRPWAFEATVAGELAAGLRLRHALVPYLYTMARRHHETGYALVEPMYYDHPGEEAAYHCPGQYRFGTELLAAPHVRPREAATNRSRRAVWLPEGEWFDLRSGARHGGGFHARYGGLGDLPVYAKAGGIVPLGPERRAITAPPERLRLLVFPGADNAFELYEDAGIGLGHREGEYAHTELVQEWDGDALEFTVAAATGETGLLPERRDYEIRVRGVRDPPAVTADAPGSASVGEPTYEAETDTLVVELRDVPTDGTASVTLEADGEDASLLAPEPDVGERIEDLLRAFDLSTMAKRELRERFDADRSDLEWIDDLAVSLAPEQVRALVETVHDVGFEHVTEADGERVVLWNDTDADAEAFTYRLSAREPVYEPIESDWTSQGGAIPAFEVVDVPDGEEWELTVAYGGRTVATYRGGAGGEE